MALKGRKAGRAKAAPEKKSGQKSAKRTPVASTSSALAEYRRVISSSGLALVLDASGDHILQTAQGFISTQSIALDRLIGCPGVPRGRVTEISGDPHTGKTTVTDHIMAECQKRGGHAVAIDAEQAKDLAYSRKIGLNTDPEYLTWIQPEAGVPLEKIWGIIDTTVDLMIPISRSRPIVLVFDSVAMPPTMQELEGDFDPGKPAVAASANRAAMRRITAKLARTDIALVVVNHLYTKIGHTFGDPRVEYGGNAFPMHASLRLRFSTSSLLKSEARGVYGAKVRVEVKKSKVSPTTAHSDYFAVLHGRGINNAWSVHEHLKSAKYIGGGQGGWHELRAEGFEPLRWRAGEDAFLHFETAVNEYPELWGNLVSLYMQSGVGALGMSSWTLPGVAAEVA